MPCVTHGLSEVGLVAIVDEYKPTFFHKPANWWSCRKSNDYMRRSMDQSG